MHRRVVIWSALTALWISLFSLAAPASAAPGTTAWILLGGKGKAAKVAGLQLLAEPGQDQSILLRLNLTTWADGYIVSDAHRSELHFHGRVGDFRDRGKGVGLGYVSRYEESGPALQLASDALMDLRASQNALARVGFNEARIAGNSALAHLYELRDYLSAPAPDSPPARLLALARVRTAIQRQERAATILINLTNHTSTLHAIRRARKALTNAERETRRAVILMAGSRR